jgi:uncharacterized membrane protein YeaQ/YmgE (transglycosylase-associated protein family)
LCLFVEPGRPLDGYCGVRPSGRIAVFEGVDEMIGLLVWLIVGGVVGWLAGMVMRDSNGMLVNIVVGIVGAFIGGLLLGGGTINQVVTLNSFIVSLIGAIILLAVVNLVRRGRLR